MKMTTEESVMKIPIQGLITLSLLFSVLFTVVSYSASLSDSILEIPKGTLFELHNELEIPANQNFLLLGKNMFNESFNSINQELNKSYQVSHQHNRSFYHYNDYLNQWQQTAEQSYQACLERHRVYYRNRNNSSANNTIITRGNGNTNVIINNQTNTAPTHGSYISDNACIKPEHTIALLLLDTDESKNGGAFREGYQFKVKSVRLNQRGDFDIVTIYFDHKIAKAVRIITTQSANQIVIHQLQRRKVAKGFWEGLGSALLSLTHIGGEYFTIKLPIKHYYD